MNFREKTEILKWQQYCRRMNWLLVCTVIIVPPCDEPTIITTLQFPRLHTVTQHLPAHCCCLGPHQSQLCLWMIRFFSMAFIGGKGTLSKPCSFYYCTHHSAGCPESFLPWTVNPPVSGGSRVWTKEWAKLKRALGRTPAIKATMKQECNICI